MKIAYIILAHKNPEQVARLIKTLKNPDVIFSIHIDIKSNIHAFNKHISDLKSSEDDIIFLKKRFNTKWGSFNTVRATIDLIKSVLPLSPDNIILLSGQHYPLKNYNEIQDYLNRFKGKALLEFQAVDMLKPNRISHYYFADYFNYNKEGFNYKKVPILARVLTKILPKRKFLKGVTPYIGRQWFVFPLDIAQYVVTEFKKRRELSDFYKYALLSDEQYFQTLLMNSKYKSRICNVSVCFADYRYSNPVIWKLDDFADLALQNNLFARKFDTQLDYKILNEIDRKLLS